MPGLGIWNRVIPGVNVSDPGVSLGGLNEETHGNMGILPVKANILLEGVGSSKVGEGIEDWSLGQCAYAKDCEGNPLKHLLFVSRMIPFFIHIPILGFSIRLLI